MTGRRISPQSQDSGVTGTDISLLKAKDVMQYGVICVEGSAPVPKAIATCLEKKLSALPVLHEGRLQGILSVKDVLRLLYEQDYLPGMVRDYMSTDVVTFDIEDPISDIHAFLMESVFRRVPILYSGKVAGIVARIDLLRAYKELFHPVGESNPSVMPLQMLRAEDVMKCGLLTVHPESSLFEAMDLLVTHQVTGLPVVDGGMHIKGIITEKDLLNCINDPDAHGASVEHYMTHYVITFDRRASLHDVCECLIDHQFHRIPIVDGDRLVGIISRSDIMANRSAMFKL